MELGSEYSLELNNLSIASYSLFDYLKDYNYEFFDSGRSSIQHIPFSRGKKVLLPEFVCESVCLCFPKNQVVFYKITENFQIDIEDLENKVTPDVGVIFVVHYFGAVHEEMILERIRLIADRLHAIVIEDTTQSLFSVKKTIGDYVVASIRKWLPIPSGGVLYRNGNAEMPSTKDVPKSIDNYRAYGMMLKDMFLRMGFDCNQKYREIFEESEDSLNHSSIIYLMSDFSRFIISCIDIGQLIERRKSNYQQLLLGLRKLGLFPIIQLKQGDCPFVLPIRVKNRDEFRKYLISNQIYCAVHWPIDVNNREQRHQAEENANTLISLPIDQRYEKKDIQYLVDCISKYGGELSF